MVCGVGLWCLVLVYGVLVYGVLVYGVGVAVSCTCLYLLDLDVAPTQLCDCVACACGV